MRSALAVGVGLAGLVSACGVGGSSPVGNNSGMSISVDSEYDPQVVVGSVYTVDIDIKSTGTTDIPKLDLMFDSGDKFLDHNVIVKSDPCTLDKSLPGFACGDLGVGKGLRLGISYRPKDVGNFNYEFEVADDGLVLPEGDGNEYTYSWKQIVGAG